MDANTRSDTHQASPSSEHAGSGSGTRWDASRSTLKAGSAPLQHRPSMATTRSTSSASSSSHRSYPTPAALTTAAASSPSSSHISPSRPSAYSETIQSLDHRTTQPRTKRVPVYIRIVPKDIWLRIHVNPSQTIGSIKDAALLKANAPEHDPSLSYRFYQDAVNASAHAKIAPVAGHDKVVKHRSYALPRSFLCPPPDLSDVAATIAASVAHTSRSRKSSRSDYSQQPRALRAMSQQPPPPPPVPPLPNFDNAYSPREAPVALPSASTSQQTLHYGSPASPHSRAAPLPLMSRTAGGGSSSSARSTSGDDNVIGSSPANIVRQVSNSTLATSTPSTSSDYGAASSRSNAAFSSDASASDTSLSQARSQSQSYAANEVAIRFDTSLIMGDQNAKLEEDQARTRLSQWNAHRESTGNTTSPTRRDANLSVLQLQKSPRRKSSPAHSYNSTPTIASSSTFDSDAVSSPNMMGSPSSLDPFAAHSSTLHPATAATPPRRPIRLNPGSLGGANPAIFYTQPGACESFSSLASMSSPSSAELLTTADDDALIMQWGTQAEASPLSDRPSSPTRPLPSPSVGAASIAPLSSPLQPSTALLSGSPSASSPVRPRSKTVTAADVLRSRAASKDEVPPPPPALPEGFSSPVRISSLPRPPARKMVAESSQRREGPQPELLELLKGSARDPPIDDDDDDDDDKGFSTVKQQRGTRAPPMQAMALRKKPSDSSTSSAIAGPSSAYVSTVAADSSEQYIAGIRLDEVSRVFKDASHPLSCKYAVLSSANGCELEEWKTVAASLIRPYELLELQWSIPTERVYIPPISVADTVRISSTATSNKSMFKQAWGEEPDAGPDADALCLEPYFEGWVYVLKGGGAVAGKTEKSAKALRKMGKWKLHFMTVKGWRIDLYRKKPRAGEAVLPVAEQVWSLRSIDWVAVDADHPIPANAALPGLETMPRSSVTVAFSPKGSGAGTSSWMSSSPGALASSESTLTLRCISHFDHQAMSILMLRAWYRCSATAASTPSSTSGGVDNWRRKAMFRAIVAGRGGTVAAGRVGRGVNGGRNARARTRLRPSGWPKEWEDADQWSSESEREEIAPPAELEHALSVQQQQSRRDTVTQAKADQSAAAQRSSRKQEVDEKMVLPHGMYAALLGRSSTATTDAASSSTAMSSGLDIEALSPKQEALAFASGIQAIVRPRHLAQSPSLPHLEPGLMLGGSHAHFGSSQTRRRGSGGGGGHGRGGTSSRSPDAAVDRIASSSSLRSRSMTVSSPDSKAAAASAARGRSTPANSSPSSRNVSREASPLPSSGSSSRKGSGSGASYNVSPALVPGFVDVAPSPSVMLLKKYKASQKAQASSGSKVDDTA